MLAVRERLDALQDILPEEEERFYRSTQSFSYYLGVGDCFDE
jgi:hypothetical protein